MVSGTDEHGTPIQVQADHEGVTPRELADRNALVIAKDLQNLGLSYDLFTRTTTKNHYAIAQEIFLGLLENGYVFPQTQLGAISPSTGRTLPDRYIEGTCPICGYPQRARRPVRQLRQPARPDRPDQPGVQDQRRDAEVRRDRADDSSTCGAFARGARRLAEEAGPLAAQRAEVQPQPARRPQAARRTPATSSGASRCRSTAGATAPTRRSTSGSTPSSATCRPRSSGRSARGDPEAWRAWWQDPDAAGLLLHGQGQHRLPRRDLAGDAVRLLGHRRQGRHARARSAR